MQCISSAARTCETWMPSCILRLISAYTCFRVLCEAIMHSCGQTWATNKPKLINQIVFRSSLKTIFFGKKKLLISNYTSGNIFMYVCLLGVWWIGSWILPAALLKEATKNRPLELETQSLLFLFFGTHIVDSTSWKQKPTETNIWLALYVEFQRETKFI